jgi:hypothetical protein
MEKDNKEFDALEALDRQIHEREEKIMKDLLESKKGRERLPVGRMEPLPYEETNTLINNPNNKRDDLVAEATEGMNAAGVKILGIPIKGDANLLDKGVATEAQMKKYLGNEFIKKTYVSDSDYREEMNYYYYIEKNSLNDVNPKDIKFNKNGTITVKNKEGKEITLSQEKSYEATLYHQKVYDAKGNFIGIKSHINPELNRKFKNNEGYELVLSHDMNRVVKDYHNTGTFNWDSDNYLEHLATDVEFYKKYGSGINDETTRKEREKTGEFITGYWMKLITDVTNPDRAKLKKYIEENKIQIVTPKVLQNYQDSKAPKLMEEKGKSFIRR